MRLFGISSLVQMFCESCVHFETRMFAYKLQMLQVDSPSQVSYVSLGMMLVCPVHVCS